MGPGHFVKFLLTRFFPIDFYNRLWYNNLTNKKERVILMQAITSYEATLIMKAMEVMFRQNMVMLTGKIPDAKTIEQVVHATFQWFCDLENIVDIIEEENEDEKPDIPDDVDETNYDPYMGCDSYDDYSIDEGW